MILTIILGIIYAILGIITGFLIAVNLAYFEMTKNTRLRRYIAVGIITGSIWPIAWVWSMVCMILDKYGYFDEE